MFSNWRRKIDNEEKVQKDLQRKIERQDHEAGEKRYKEWLTEFGKRFNCHICGKLPTGQKQSSYLTMDGWEYTPLDLPNGLWTCAKCRKWTCVEHIHKEICKECAEKM
jgi:hypothetical protein